MKRLVGDREGTVLIVDVKPGLPVTNIRAEGFLEGLQGADNLRALDVQYHNDDPNAATTIVQSTLASQSDLVGIFATSEPGANGAVTALQAAGEQAEDVAVVAYDAGPVLVEGLREGLIDALIAQGSYKQGYEALERVVDEIQGDATGEFNNVIDNVLVTPENIDDEEIVPYLYPETCG